MGTLYFKQLLSGRDFAKNNAFAGQMENFVYLIGDKDKKECLVVDPAWDIQGILDIAASDDMKVVGALATHYHPDHVGGTIMGFNIAGLAELMRLNPCTVHAHKLEKQGMMQVTGLSDGDIVGHDSGDVVSAGDVCVDLLHTPGHTPGSMCFRLKDALVSGDTLFLQGCGRVDLPGGNTEQMFETLTQRLSTIPGDTILFPGHAYGGDHAPLAAVRQNNAMLRVKDLATWNRIHGH